MILSTVQELVGLTVTVRIRHNCNLAAFSSLGQRLHCGGHFKISYNLGKRKSLFSPTRSESVGKGNLIFINFRENISTGTVNRVPVI